LGSLPVTWFFFNLLFCSVCWRVGWKGFSLMCQKYCKARGSQHPAGTDPNLAALVWLLKKMRPLGLRGTYLSGCFLSPALQITSEPIPCLQTNLIKAAISEKSSFWKFLENAPPDGWAALRCAEGGWLQPEPSPAHPSMAKATWWANWSPPRVCRTLKEKCSPHSSRSHWCCHVMPHHTRHAMHSY